MLSAFHKIYSPWEQWDPNPSGNLVPLGLRPSCPNHHVRYRAFPGCTQQLKRSRHSNPLRSWYCNLLSEQFVFHACSRSEQGARPMFGFSVHPTSVHCSIELCAQRDTTIFKFMPCCVISLVLIRSGRRPPSTPGPVGLRSLFVGMLTSFHLFSFSTAQSVTQIDGKMWT